eukprot:5530358-Prymnesium_polylepis.2
MPAAASSEPDDLTEEAGPGERNGAADARNATSAAAAFATMSAACARTSPEAPGPNPWRW